MPSIIICLKDGLMVIRVGEEILVKAVFSVKLVIIEATKTKVIATTLVTLDF